jgi:acyl-CoA reductase-like NAD-dependent aldehyde dehydrogenase
MPPTPSAAEKAHARARAHFASGATLPLSARRANLLALRKMIIDNMDAIRDAVAADLGKPQLETDISETSMALHDIKSAVDSLEAWAAPQAVSGGIANAMDNCEIRRDPRGCVLIYGAFNYPIQLTLVPLVGALAGGCTAVLKPSELSPATASLLETMLPKYLPSGVCEVVTGGVEVASALLEKCRWDLVFFTGSTNVGRIIARKCAETLTPTVLELGGKSPCIVTRCSDMHAAAQRILWGRCLNAGQSCIAPDYVLVLDDAHDALVAALKDAVAKFYGTDTRPGCSATRGSLSLARIVNETHFKRIMAMIAATRGTVVVGGEGDAATLRIDPTIITDVSPDDATMTEEIFGPVLPVLRVKSVDEAIVFVTAREKPLSLYVFTDDSAVAERVLTRTTSGSAVVNDTMVQATVNALPFGGIGNSGMGAYHGRHSFNCFTHEKAVLRKKLALEIVNDLTRNPPYTASKDGRIKFALGWPHSPAVGLLRRPWVWAVALAGAAWGIVWSGKATKSA